jgi:hypothetical protein
LPCSDVTELVRVTVDADDRVRDYSLHKLACGEPVGAEDLLLSALQGQTIQEILAWDAEAFLAEFPVEEPAVAFLARKHLHAVQAAVGVLTGQESGGPNDLCAAAEIQSDGDDILIEALVTVDMHTDRIAPCGPCGGCSREAPVVADDDETR